MADKEVVIRIRGENLSGDAFKAAKAQLGDLSQYTNKVGGDTLGLGDQLRGFYKSHKESILAVTEASGLVIAGIAGIAAGIVALGDRGSEVGDIRSSFDQMNKTIGNDSVAVLGTLRDAFAGTISDFDLMKMSNQAMSEGFKGSRDQFDLLAKASRALGERGFDAREAFDTLSKAMATGKTKGAELMIGVVENTAEYKRYADSIGKTTAELSEQEKAHATQLAIQSKLNQIVKETGDITFDFTDGIAAAKAGVNNFRDSLAESVANSPAVNAMLSGFADGLKAGFGVDSAAQVKTLTGYVDKFAVFLMDAAQVAVGGAGIIGRAWSALQLVFSGVMSIVFSVGTAFANVVAGAAEMAAKLPGVGDKFQGVASSARDTANMLGGMQQSFHDQAAEALEGVKGNSAFQRTLDSVSATLGGVRAKMVEASNAHVDTAAKVKDTGGAFRKMGDDADLGTGTASKASEELRKQIRKMSDELSTGMKNLNDQEFAKKFGGDLDKLQLDMKAAGLTGEKVPKDIAAAFARLTDIKIHDWIAKEAAEWPALEAAGVKAFDSIGAAAMSAEQRIADAIGASLETQKKARQEAADYAFQTEVTQAEAAIAAAERAGVKKAEITDMEIGLATKKFNHSIELENAAFAEQTKNLDLTTQYGRDAYAALEAAHRAKVESMAETWRAANADMTEVTRVSWTTSLATLGQAFEQFGQVVGGSLGSVFGAIGRITGALDTAHASVTTLKEGFGKFTGGGGLSGILGGMSQMVSGISGIVSAVQVGIQVVTGLAHAIGSLFASEESKKVNKPRDQFIAQYGGYDALGDKLTRASNGDTADQLRIQLGKADTEAKFHDAEDAIIALIGGQKFHTGGVIGSTPFAGWPAPALASNEVPIVGMVGEGVLSKDAGMPALGRVLGTSPQRAIAWLNGGGGAPGGTDIGPLVQQMAQILAALSRPVTQQIYIGRDKVDEVVTDLVNRGLTNGSIRVPRRAVVERV